MPEAYTRQSSFSNGDVVDAPLFNAEFDQLVEAFKEDLGHNHDGTAGGGAPVPFIQKGTTGVYVDTLVPGSPVIRFKVNGTDVNVVGATQDTVSTRIVHTPVNTGVPVSLDVYLETLEVAVGDAGSDAAAAALSASSASKSADEAEAAAMTLGVPLILADGATYTISNSTVIADIVCLGNATINLPTTLTPGYRYSIRVSSVASDSKLCTIVNPSYNIIGDVLTVTSGNNLTLKRKDVVILDVISATDLEII